MFDAPDPDDVFATLFHATYNPSTNTSSADRGDFYLFDNFVVNTTTYSANGGYADNAVIHPKIDKVALYAKDTGIVILANGSIGSGYTDLQRNDYWDVFEAMAQAVSVAGYGIAYGDGSSNSIHKFAYDTEYVDFYSPRSSFFSSGTSNEIYTRSKSGRSVVACLSGTGSYGILGYKNMKRYEFRKPDAFYSGTAVPSSTVGNIKFDGKMTAYELDTASSVKFLSGANTGSLEASITSNQTWTLPSVGGTIGVLRQSESSEAGSVQYNGTTSSGGMFDGGATLPSNTSTKLNYNGTFLAGRVTAFDSVRIHGGEASFYHELSGVPTANRSLTLPDEAGTVALERIGGGTGVGSIKYNGTTPLSGAMYGGSAISTNNANQLNYDGILTAARLVGGSVRVTGGTAYEVILSASPTASRTVTLPNYDGTVAMLRTAGDTGEGSLKYSGTSAVAGTLNGGTTAPTATGRLNYEGYFYATRVYNAVWNDIVDFVEAPEGLVVEYGKVYIRNKEFLVEKSSQYMQKGILGIASDTFGIAAGKVEDHNQIPIAIGGYVLAHTRGVYEPGTCLTSDAEGYLIEMSDSDKVAFPERIAATFDRPETKTVWNGVQVNGRNWVKVK
jgi:hypothetical protein